MKISQFSIRIIIVSFLLLFLSCKEDDFVAFENSRSLQDVMDDFAQLEFNEGINDIELEGSFSNTVWRFRVIVPEGASETNRRPLVVCLHGAASLIDPELHMHTECLEEPGFASLSPILLCPNSEGFGWFDFPEQEKIVTLTGLVKEHLPVDQNKIAIMGYSDGGNGAWFYAQYYPNVFNAAIPMASLYNPDRIDLPTARIDIPLYVIHGENDQLWPLNLTQEYINTTVEAGTNLEFVIAEGLEHYNSCAYVPYLVDAVTWLQTEAWSD